MACFVCDMFGRFAAIMKVGGVISEEGRPRLQRDISQMESWADRWQMELKIINAR